MSNYTNQNLINVPSNKVPAGTLAMKVGQNIFTAGHVIIQMSSSGTQDLDAYVVQSNSGVLYARKLKFNGTQASDSATLELLSDSSVLIFNTGHPEPQGGSAPRSSMDFYKCTYVNSDSWGGRKAVINHGIYEFLSDSISGLIYGSGYIPKVGNIYTDGALVRVAALFDGIPVNGLVFYASLSASTNTAETGQTLTTTGSPVFSSYLGIPAAYFSGSDVIEAANTNIPYSESPFSISLWVNIASNPSGNHGIFSFGSTSSNGALIAVIHNSTGILLSGHGQGYGWDNQGSASATFDGTWKHLAVVFGQGESGSRTASVYINGTAVKSGSFIYDPYAYQNYTPQVFIGAYWGTNAPYVPNLTGYLAAVRVYNRALTSAEITTLVSEFTPTA